LVLSAPQGRRSASKASERKDSIDGAMKIGAGPVTRIRLEERGFIADFFLMPTGLYRSHRILPRMRA
jgi:hypothetical protein